MEGWSNGWMVGLMRGPWMYVLYTKDNCDHDRIYTVCIFIYQ